MNLCLPVCARFLKRRPASLVYLVLISLSMGGCGSEAGGSGNLAFVQSGEPSQTSVTRVYGRAQVDQPLREGRVTLAHRSVKLSSLGNFDFASSPIQIPSIVFVEGLLDGEVVHLEAEMPRLPPAQTFVHVNTVTTIVSRYHRLHPELTFQQAESKVLSSLNLQGRPDYRDGIRHPHSGFSERDFLEKARTSGGFDKHLEYAVALIDSRPISPKLPDIDFAGLASGLGSAIGRFAAQKVLGWGLATIGLDVTNTQISDTLKELSTQLAEIQSSLNNLLTLVQNLANSVLVQSIRDTLAQISEQDSKYQNAVEGLYSESQTLDLIADILSYGTWIRSIDQAQLPTDGSTGLMELTARQVSPRFVTPRTQGVLQSQADYYQSYQLRATNLLVEAAHASNPVLGFDAERYLDQYYISAKRQNSTLKLAMFVTPSKLFPPPVSNSNQPPFDTIAIWPSIGRSLEDLLGNLPPRLSPYPTIPDGLAVDVASNRVWESTAHGSWSLTSIPGFLSSYQADGYSWHLPSLAELRDLRRSIDAQTLAEFVTTDSGSSPGYQGFLWTRDSETANAIQGNRVRNQFIYNFLSDTDITVGPYTTDSDSDGAKEPQARDPRTVNDPLLIPMLLVADFSPAYYQPTLQVSVASSVNNSQCTAKLVYSVKDSNGNSVQKTLDVTNHVVWDVLVNGSRDSINLKAHIGNGTFDSGNLVFRKLIRSTDQIVVSAQFAGLSATQSVTPLTPDLRPQSLLLSPSRLVVEGVYPTNQRLVPTLVTNDGTFDNKIGTQFITFSSSDPSVTVSPGGTVNVTLPDTTPKVVQVNAVYNDGINPAVNGVSTFILQPQ